MLLRHENQGTLRFEKTVPKLKGIFNQKYLQARISCGRVGNANRLCSTHLHALVDGRVLPLPGIEERFRFV